MKKPLQGDQRARAHRRPAALVVLAFCGLAALGVLWNKASVLYAGAADPSGAVATTRSGILTAIAGLLAFTGVMLSLQETRRANDRTDARIRDAQVSERYTRTIDQLGSPSLDVRLGSVYALGRLARDSPDDQAVIVDVLSAFVREHSTDSERVSQGRRSADIRAAVVVLASLPVLASVPVRADLAGANLTGHASLAGLRFPPLSNLSGFVLSNADLAGADLRGAELSDAQLDNANLAGARLARARLFRAVLTRADLKDASLADARIAGANLADASLPGADLSRARFVELLPGFKLTTARLTGADLTGADLSEAKLQFVDLTNAKLSHAKLWGANLSHARIENTDLTGAEGIPWSVNAPADGGDANSRHEAPDPYNRVMQVLATSERVVSMMRPHWAKLIPALLATVGALPVSILTTILFTGDGAWAALASSIAWLLFLVSAGWALWKVATWHGEVIAVTNNRLIKIGGVSDVTVDTQILLSEITDIKYSRTPLGRMFGYGEMEIMEAGPATTDPIQIRYVPMPDQLYLTLSDIVLGGPPGTHQADARRRELRWL